MNFRLAFNENPCKLKSQGLYKPQARSRNSLCPMELLKPCCLNGRNRGTTVHHLGSNTSTPVADLGSPVGCQRLMPGAQRTLPESSPNTGMRNDMFNGNLATRIDHWQAWQVTNANCACTRPYVKDLRLQETKLPSPSVPMKPKAFSEFPLGF